MLVAACTLDDTGPEPDVKIDGIAAAETHSLFLADDGSLWACGANGSYQTGIDKNVGEKHEIQKIPNIPDIKFISCGYHFSLAVTSTGEVYGWGENIYKPLGAQVSGEITMPKLIDGIFDVIAVGGGLDFSIALTSGGSVYSWGASGSGVLGCDPLPSPFYRETPGLSFWTGKPLDQCHPDIGGIRSCSGVYCGRQSICLGIESLRPEGD